LRQSPKNSLSSSGLFHSGFFCTFGSSDLDLSAISGAQRARHRGELRDPSSMPGSPAILIKLWKIIRKTHQTATPNFGINAVKAAAHMTDVCLGPFLAHGVAPFLHFS